MLINCKKYFIWFDLILIYKEEIHCNFGLKKVCEEIQNNQLQKTC